MACRTVRSYFEATPETERELARRAGVSQGTVNKLRRRTRGFRVGLEVALLLEWATAGAVGADALPLTPRARRALRASREVAAASEART